MLDIKRPKTTKQSDGLSYYERNKDKIKARIKEYGKSHKEEIAKRMAIYNKNRSLERRKYEQNYRDSHKKDARIYGEKYRELNKEKIHSRELQYSETMRYRYNQWRINAKKRGKEWGLTFEDINSMPLVCHYTGCELVLKRNQNNTISLDRLDSSKGYIKGNVAFCLATINSMKYTLSPEDFYKICKMVVEHRDKQKSSQERSCWENSPKG